MLAASVVCVNGCGTTSASFYVLSIGAATSDQAEHVPFLTLARSCWASGQRGKRLRSSFWCRGRPRETRGEKGGMREGPGRQDSAGARGKGA